MNLKTTFLLIAILTGYNQLSAQRIIQRRPAAEQATRKRDAGSPIDSVRLIFPGAQKIEKINSCWNAAKDQKGNTLGYVLNSIEYGKENKGFGDDVPTWVILDKKGVIRKVCIINSYETRSYQRLVHRKKFYNQWLGLNLQSAGNKDIDIVTGATLTSTAVKNNMKLIIDQAIKTKPAGL
ncbi:MAG: FMN-binding protein [Bacteroidales bacterium]